MKAKVLKLCSLLMALLVMTSLLAACGDENPFLGDWDDDAGEQSLIFLEDGTGAQTNYYGAIEFTYTWEGDTVTMTSEELGISAEATLEDNVLYMDYSSFVKVDQAAYVPENLDEDDSEEGYEDDSEDTGDSDTELDFWIGEYANDNGTLTIDVSSGMLYYAMGVSTEDGFSTASGTLTEDSSDPYVLEESDFIFRYDDSDNSIEISLQDDAGDYEHYTGWYYYVGPVGGSDASEGDATLDVEAPDSIEAWYGEYENDTATLTITDSLEDMVDYDLASSDGWRSGTWTVSDHGLGVVEDRELYVIYHVEDGSIEITGKTEAANENNASYIGVYYPVE